MVARDQEPLIRCRTPYPRQPFETIAQAHLGIGRAGMAEHAGAWTAAGGNALDELAGFIDPSGIEHGASAQEHQPGRPGLLGTRRESRGAGTLEGKKTAARDVGDALHHAVGRAIDQQDLAHDACSGTRHQRRKGCDRRLLDALGGDNDAQHAMRLRWLILRRKSAALLSSCHIQDSSPVAPFSGKRLLTQTLWPLGLVLDLFSSAPYFEPMSRASSRALKPPPVTAPSEPAGAAAPFP